MKQRSQKNVKRRPGESTRTPLAPPNPVTKPKWIDGQALFFVILIALIGLTSILFPLNFYLFAFNAQSGLPVSVQILWTLAAIGSVLLVARNAIPRIPGWALYVTAALSIASFFVLRTTYPTLLGDGGSGAMPKHFIIHWDLFPSMGRLAEFLCLHLSRIIPRSVGFFYHRTILYDNELMNNTMIIETLIFGVLTTIVLCVALRQMALTTSERTGILALTAFSVPLLNGYGNFYSYIVPVFITLLWFVFLWVLHRHPTAWFLYALLPVLFGLCLWAHPVLWLHPAFMVMMLALIFLLARGIVLPSWLIYIGAIGLACAPLVFMPSRANPYLAALRLDDTFGLHIYTRLLCCLEVAAPALILTGLVLRQNRDILRKPTPIQSVALVSLISSVLLVFTSQIEMALYTVHSYSMYGATIYGAAVILYLTSCRNPRSVFYSAILGGFLFFPTAYVQSRDLQFDRLLKLYPHDRSSTTYQAWGPYLKLGLSTPIDTPDNRRRKLEAFKAGVTTTIPDWQPFRGLNLMYYTAWCFELGEIEAGTQALVQVFDQPQALQDLWHSGTRFTAWSENRAYKRIRESSRKIIQDSLARNPSNPYFRQLSDLLALYEKRDP